MISRRFRELVFKFHTWLGVHLFAFLALFFLTGTLLIFGNQIEAALISSERLSEPVQRDERASFGALYENARAYAPEATVREITRAQTSWIADQAVVAIPGSGMRTLWFGAQDETVSREAGAMRLFIVVRQLHDSMFTNHRIGAILASSLSLFLAGFLISGAISYRRFWRGYFRHPQSHLGARGWWGGFHRLAAVWSLPFLAIIALTGMFFLLQTLVQLPYRSISDQAILERSAILPENFDGDYLDQAVEQARIALAGGSFDYMSLPTQSGDGILLSGTNGVVLIDPSNLAVADRLHVRDRNNWEMTSDLVYLLHYGTWGGLGTQILWFLFGILATVLSASGAIVYASRTRDAGEGSNLVTRFWSASILTKLGYPAFAFGLITVVILRLT